MDTGVTYGYKGNKDYGNTYGHKGDKDYGISYGHKGKSKDYGISYGYKGKSKDYGITYGYTGNKKKGGEMQHYSVKGKAKGLQQPRNAHQGYCGDCWQWGHERAFCPNHPPDIRNMLLWHKSPAPRSSSSSTQEYITAEFSMETNGEDFSADSRNSDHEWWGQESYKEHGVSHKEQE